MADEWKPVVGGRAMLPSGAPCVILALGPGGLCWYACFPWSGGVQTDVHSSRLTEHPDDARHRRLLEAARDVVRLRDALFGAPPHSEARRVARQGMTGVINSLRAIIAEHDADHDHA